MAAAHSPLPASPRRFCRVQCRGLAPGAGLHLAKPFLRLPSGGSILFVLGLNGGRSFDDDPKRLVVKDALFTGDCRQFRDNAGLSFRFSSRRTSSWVSASARRRIASSISLRWLSHSSIKSGPSGSYEALAHNSFHADFNARLSSASAISSSRKPSSNSCLLGDLAGGQRDLSRRLCFVEAAIRQRVGGCDGGFIRVDHWIPCQ